MADWLILVYPKDVKLTQPKEVLWFKNKAEFEEREQKLAEAGESFISFKAKALRVFHFLESCEEDEL